MYKTAHQALLLFVITILTTACGSQGQDLTSTSGPRDSGPLILTRPDVDSPDAMAAGIGGRLV